MEDSSSDEENLRIAQDASSTSEEEQLSEFEVSWLLEISSSLCDSSLSSVTNDSYIEFLNLTGN